MNNSQLFCGIIIATLAAGFAGTVAAQSAEPIKIGVLTPLSGTYASLGQQVRWGIELATKEINDAGGVMGRKIELLFEDEEANPSVATPKAEKLFQVSKVDFLTGTVSSASTLAVGQVAERNERLIATTVSFSDAITGDKCSPNVFRVNAKAGQQSVALAEWLSNARPNAEVFYLGPDYEMGRSTVHAFKTAAEAKGAKTVGEVFAPLDNKDYSPFFGQIRAARPNVMYTSVAGNDTVRLFNQLSEYGLLKKMAIVGASGTVTSQNLDAMGKNAEGFTTGVGYSLDLDIPENKKFVAAFDAAYKASPDLYGADSYGVMYFYKAAVEKAQSTDTVKVRKAMEGLEWMTPQGKKTMRAGDHQAIQDMYVTSLQNGQFKVLSKVDGAAAIGPDTCTRF
ncbi:ABC transporter substrate-binding protein [Eoetvoesiella caeni]|uniref:Amino acid/amide ABC transporter substrate-binding protein (HAAT family) n=1 Tax=Eoetvoesiella caeni TaxID=645616 RepID=A0A366HH13_9BURK|nr:ABC transporter substrate-binding protein [Eoetvoesiella caeni]MCI2808035.1 ABC transporter substrate-binding protein [Eoetvoesiella caeni]NYT53962.1 ABC transporter substrate-binding protein [Eoetvoesiella caeni]RBP41955.1 amino acid/amide ABC transporter substrate-binding protein (HAAT family) [Eoetvoesiella caeni]